MTLLDPFSALALPSDTLVDRRVPKTMLIDNGGFSSGDRRRIEGGVSELRWLAALKPATVGIAEYRDAEREYIEIAVLKLELRRAVRSDRIVELVHRAVPYPVLMIVWVGGSPEISLAHKRRSLGEADKTVIDGPVVTARASEECAIESLGAFRKALALKHQPRETLKDLYQGWIDTIHAFQAAAITGCFRPLSTAAATVDREVALREYWRITERIEYILSAAGRETQMSRRAELNVELARLRASREAARNIL